MLGDLVILDSGCNVPGNPLFSGRVYIASRDGSSIRPIVENQSLPETVSTYKRKDETRLIWTAMGFPGAPDGSVWSAGLDGSDASTVVPPGTFLNTPKQICVDQEGGKIYVCDREGMKICRFNLDGSDMEVLVETGHANDECHRGDATRWCVGLAIDWKERHLYWTQKGPPKGGKGRIFRANLDPPKGQAPATRSDIECLMVQLPEPVHLQIDSESGYLYWTDRGDVPHGNSLNRCHLSELNGDKPLVCRVLEMTPYECLVRNLHDPIGLKLDPANSCVFVTDMGGTVYRFDMEGRNKVKMYEELEACFSGITLIN